jgi:tetratricopeptide (TPR) repeat protein
VTDGRPSGAARSRSSRPPTASLTLITVAIAVVIGMSACSESVDPDQALAAGLAQQQAGNDEAAAASYQDVLDVRPGDKFANYNLGVIEQGEGRTALAEGYYRAALSTDPAFVPALYNLAILRTAVGATQEAIDLYVRVVEAQPDYAAAHLNLGLLYQKVGEVKRGERELNRALEIDPTLADRLATQPIGPEGGRADDDADADAAPTASDASASP